MNAARIVWERIHQAMGEEDPEWEFYGVRSPNGPLWFVIRDGDELAAVTRNEARSACWDSPFDYAGHALLYVPRNLPEPNSDEHTRAVVEVSLPLIEASGGRSRVLRNDSGAEVVVGPAPGRIPG